MRRPLEEPRRAGDPLRGRASDRGRRPRVGRGGRRLDAEEPLPADTEARLAAVHRARGDGDLEHRGAAPSVGRLADEQAALRRVATLVAHESSPAEVFAAVAEEVAGLLGVEDMRMVRYEADGDGHRRRGVGRARRRLPGRYPLPLGAKNIASLVLRDRAARPHRRLREGHRRDREAMRASMGVRSRGRRSDRRRRTALGRMVAARRRPSRCRPDTESRLGEFTELVATAIANTEARTELAASRARIVAATDEERRRVVRDLHDGAQQRLVHTIITLKLARRALENETRRMRRPADRGARPRRAGDRRAARARPRHPPGGPHPRRAARGSGRARVADAGAGRERRVRRPAPCRGRGDRLLRRRRGAHQRRQTRSRRARRGHGARRGRHARRPTSATTASEAPGPTAAASSGSATGSPRSTAELRVESPADGGTLVAAAIPLPG